MPEETVDLDKICYKKNFLSKVIARVNYKTISDFDLPKELAEKLKEVFQIMEPVKMTGTEFQITGPEISAKSSEITEWHFFGKAREKKLTVSQEAFFVEFDAYESFEKLKEDFLTVFDKFTSVYGEVLQINFFGLRYINNIDIPEEEPLNWTKYIKEKMLDTFNFAKSEIESDDFLSRAFQILEYNYGDFNLRYQFGMPNPDYPAPIRRKYYVLDLDTFYSGQQEVTDIKENIDKFHKCIQTAFEKSITEELRGAMNE